jgi:translation initiation factor 5B
LTKKEKDRKHMADIRKQALLASGVQIEGLQQVAGNGVPKKVVYGSNRKKKGPEARDPSPIPESGSRPLSPQLLEEEEGEDVKDDWEASSEDQSKPVAPEDVKDDWEISSEGEENADASSIPEPALPKSVPRGTCQFCS